MNDSDAIWDEFEHCIRIAGNAGPRSLFALWQKGYSVRHYSVLQSSGEFQSEYEAKKSGNLFSATTAEELLGLVSLWETRSESWQDATDEEWAKYEQLMDEAPVYNEDGKQVHEDRSSVVHRAADSHVVARQIYPALFLQSTFT